MVGRGGEKGKTVAAVEAVVVGVVGLYEVCVCVFAWLERTQDAGFVAGRGFKRVFVVVVRCPCFVRKRSALATDMVDTWEGERSSREEDRHELTRGAGTETCKEAVAHLIWRRALEGITKKSDQKRRYPHQ